MEKNIVWAVVLSSVVIIVFYVINGALFAPVQPNPSEYPAAQSQPQVSTATVEPETAPVQETPPSEYSGVSQIPSTQVSQPSITTEVAGPQVVDYITINTELITVVLTSAGGDIVSWKLKEHFNNNREENVEMILSGVREAHAFSLAFGGLEASPVSDLFYVNRISEYSIEFYRDFSAYGTNEKFRLTKRYDFKPNDYMFELTISLDGGFSIQGFNYSGNAYTLSFGPQIGPKFEKLDNYYDYRHYFTFINGKRKNAKVNENIDSRPAWAAISGKYFTLIALPYLAQYSLVFTETAEDGIPSASRLNIIRPAVNTSRVADTYRFYLGPKNQDVLSNYNTGRNDFGLMDTQLVEAASSRGPLGPLEKLLKWLLLGFYKIVPNYGIAIILLTLLIKILFFPLTKKGSEATLRMQALAPKIKEIQEKYKGNSQKLNAEMATFYKKEGYNPISGCLPMLLQIPIFIAMYNLFNNHFDLRGAMFIPGWIPDLSLPESIVNFPDGFRLPILGWTALRGLPFIYVGSQLLYGKVTQMPGQQSNAQMKMMLYIMPLVFFFILYNVPSGLLIYWIFSNLLTLVQQVIINKYNLAKREHAEPQPVIVPPKKRKK